MGVQQVFPYDPSEPKTLQVDYRPGGFLVPEATKMTALAVENVAITNGTMGTSVTGSVVNHGAAVARGPELYLFAIDSGGRPYDFGYDSSTADLATGSSWGFQMTVPSPVSRYIAFPVYGQQRL